MTLHKSHIWLSTSTLYHSTIFKTIADESTGAIKSVGLFGKTIDELKKSLLNIKTNGLFNSIFNIPLIDDNVITKYNAEIKKAIANNATFAERQQIMQSAMKGTNRATAQLIDSTNGATVSTEALTAAQKSSTLAAKAHSVALKALSVAGNMILFTAITKGIELVVKGFDNWIHRVEKANEAMQDAVGEYESAKSSLESINSELEEQNKQLDELLSKDNLTYAEKGQLEELQAITQELLLQQDIEEKRAANASKEAANKAVDAYEKQYGKYDTTEESLKEKLSYENFPLPESTDDVLGMVAAYVHATELLEQSKNDYNNAKENGEDTTWLFEDYQSNIDAVEEYSQALDESISDLQEKRSALEEEYNKAIKKRDSGTEPLTSSEKDIITVYESIYDVMKMVYEYTDQNGWNNMEIEGIFNTKGIEKTKEELVKMAESGELTPETIAGYKNLNKAIQDSELFLENGQTAAEAFCEEIYRSSDMALQFRDALSSAKSKFGETFKLEINTDELKDAKENLEYELEKLSDWGLDDYSGFVQYGIQSIFGNVDMDKRTIITWSDELKQTYADALASWDYDPDIGGIDTVFGGSSRFGEGLNGTGWEVAFTPILPDGTFLSSDTVYEYIESIVEEAYSQNGEVTEDALKSIDAQGKQIGDTFVHGIFAAVDDSLDYDNNGNLAETVGRLMHFSGDFGAVKLAKEEIEKAKEILDWDSWFGENVKTPEEIGIFQDIIDKARSAADAVEQYNIARKGLVNNVELPALSINETIDQLNTRLKPAFDDLQSAYQDIFTSDGFDLDAVDISMLENIRSAIEDLNESEDFSFTIDMGAFDDFAKTLTDANTTEAEAQQAFDNLATSIFYATDATEGMSEETLKLVGQLLESLGVTNAEEVALYALKEAKAQAVLAAYDLTDASRDSFVALLDEGEAANLTRQEIYSLTAAEIAFGNNNLSTEQKIKQLKELAGAYGDTATAALATAIANDLASGHTDVDSAINDLMSKINNGVKKVSIDFTNVKSSKSSGSSSKSEKDTTKEFDWIEQAIENIEKEVKNLDDIVNSAYSTFSQKNEALAQEIGKVNDEIKLQQQAYDEYMRKAESIGLSEDYKTLVRDGAVNIENISDETLQQKISDYQQWYEKAVDASDAISELSTKVKDLHVKGYELQADRLEELLDNESITEKQYLEEMDNLYKEYYENQVEYAQKAHEAKLALLDKEKSYLNSVANAAASLLDKEIDKIRDNAEAQEKPLNNQIKAYNEQIDLLNKKKKPLQDELDALEDKAREENLILDLQKKQYELKRVESQRNKLVYTEDKGMIYTADTQAIRDAKKDVDDAELAIKKNDIQKQIDALDDEIERYNDLIDLANDQIDAINDAADAQVDALEKIKNKWQELIDQQEEAQNMLLLTGEFGADAISKILSGNDDDLLTQWKNSYITTLGEIDSETQGYIGDMTNQLAKLYGVDLSPLQTQFDNVNESVNGMADSLKNAVQAITGQGAASSTGGNQGSSQSAMAGAQGSTAGSLSNALTKLGDTVNDVIGSPEAEGDGTIIGEFGSMETTVNDVITAIGSGESSGSKGRGQGESSDSEGNSDNLTGSIVNLGEQTEEILGESEGDGVIGRFEQFRDVIGEANEHVTGISDGLAAIDGQEVECTIKVNIETSGGIPAFASGTALGAMNLDSAEYNAKYTGSAHIKGTANVTGNWGVRKGGRSLVGELGQELWVHSKDGTFETVGDKGAEFINTEPGDLIFNHLQTRELLDKGNIVKNGRAYANGSVQYSDGTFITQDGAVLRPLQQGDNGYDLMKAFEPLVQKILSGEEDIISNAVFEGQRQMEQWTKEITNNTAVNNITNNRNVQPSVNVGDIHITCPGVTSWEVMRQIKTALDNEVLGLHNYADQQSRIR